MTDMPHARGEAPIFMKLDKYKELLSTVAELREFIGSLKYVFDIAAEADAIRDDALRILHASLSRVERAVHEVDAGLVKPAGWQEERAADSAQLSLERLQTQLARLRKDIEYFGSEKREAAESAAE